MNGGAQPTLVALLTPAGRGAIASIVVEGPQAVSLVDAAFRSQSKRAWAQQAVDRIALGKWAASGEEVVIAQRGLTRVEIHCHGGDAASRSIVESLAAAGCRVVSWQEFVGKEESSPTRAAARIALSVASTERTAAVLLDQYQGALDERLAQAIEMLQRNDETRAISRLRALLSWSDLGLHLTTPWRVAIGGLPNVGKSTLINALVGYERAIVFDQPGTTRDVVTAMTAIDGWPVELADTAGLRTSDEPLEQAGVERAAVELQTADLALLVFDVSQPWTNEMQQLLNEQPDAMVVHNKADLLQRKATEDDPNCPPDRPGGALVSAKTARNIPALLSAIGKRLVADAPPPGEAMPFTCDQVAPIRQAIEHADRHDLRRAVATLMPLIRPGGS